MSDVQVTCFGEVLWDIFPTHKVIGGAPLNVALRLQSLGVSVAMISSVGDDEIGNDVVEYLRQNSMELSYIQKDSNHPTGQVIVTLNENGSASYRIHKPVAWDTILLNKVNVELVSNSEVFVFGSLVCRESTSKETLFNLIEHANYKVFDANLRPPDYTMKLVNKLMQKADFIKMNDEEIDEICAELGHEKTSLEDQIAFIANDTDTKTICITKGSDGAVLYQNNTFYYNEGYKVVVEDTVGAGDSFLATLITKLLLQSWTPQKSIDYACAVGSLVASKKGANATIAPFEIEEMLNA